MGQCTLAEFSTAMFKAHTALLFAAAITMVTDVTESKWFLVQTEDSCQHEDTAPDCENITEPNKKILCGMVHFKENCRKTCQCNETTIKPPTSCQHEDTVPYCENITEQNKKILCGMGHFKKNCRKTCECNETTTADTLQPQNEEKSEEESEG